MPLTLTRLADAMQTVLTRDADQAARDAGFCRRRRKLSGSGFVQALVFGWLEDADASLEDLALVAAQGGCPITPQALHQRFTPAAVDCLRRVLLQAVRQVLAAQPTALPLLQRFRGVYVEDCTSICLPGVLAEVYPGCGGDPGQGEAALKVPVRWELSTGALTGLDLQSGRTSDRAAAAVAAPLPPGSLHLADLGFFDLSRLRALDEHGVYWISRLPTRLVLYDAQGQRWPLARWLAAQTPDRLDVTVQVGAEARLPCRLLAVRCPAAVRQRRQQRLRKRARKKGRKVSAAQLTLCAWTVFITNVPAARLSLAEAWVLYRARWQVELLFKLWKSHGGIDRSRGQKPERVLGEVYAKLLAMVLEHWVLLREGGPLSERSRAKAARQVRRQALLLATALGCRRQLRRALRLLRRCLQRVRRMTPRRGKPTTWQTLQDPDHSNLT